MKKFLCITLLITVLILSFAATANAAVTIVRSASKINYGNTVRLSGTTTVDGQTARLQWRSGSTWVNYPTTTTTTAGGGNYSFTIRPPKSAYYRVRVSSSYSPQTIVNVAPKINFSGRTTSAWVGQTWVLKGQLGPNTATGKYLTLRVLKSGRWTYLKRARTDRYGRFRFNVQLNRPVTYRFKVFFGSQWPYASTQSITAPVTAKWRNPFNISAQYVHYIVVRKSTYRLYYLRYGKIIAAWNCGVGMPGFSTPSGNFTVTAKRYHPTWYNPGASWSSNMPASIPWPSSPLGERALNLSASGIRIHGTTQPWLLDRPYRAISHGCIRLKNPNVIWLYDRVPVGTRVKIY